MMAEQYRYIEANVKQGVLILTITMKRLQDYETAKAVEAEFSAALSDASTSKVAVDIEQLEFLASVGFWPFLGLRHKVTEMGGRVVLCNLSKFVEQVFERTRLLINPSATSALFQKANSVNEAIEMLNAG
ncbi:MAG: STAS domain-containing protein [Planctomycetaceae bacterium]|nr:STAS domain-containing protein [Planctomycetales bacterium]MCB9920945.1 STAS domain-containing protein [Planctomycetaceae bacterium]